MARLLVTDLALALRTCLRLKALAIALLALLLLLKLYENLRI